MAGGMAPDVAKYAVHLRTLTTSSITNERSFTIRVN